VFHLHLHKQLIGLNGFCQLDSKEPLIWPNDTGYETTAINIIQFRDLVEMVSSQLKN